MKPKNIMLLGFVNKAVEYLDKHMDEEPDTRLAELKNLDLASIRDELNDNLDASLGTMQSTMSTLLKAGNEAFDVFIKDNLGKDRVSDQFNKIFDVDLDNDRKNSQEELARLLSFYNLDDDFDGETEEGYPLQEELVESSEDDEYLNEIRKNTTNDDVDDIVPIEHEQGDNEQLDKIFTEIVANEGKEEPKQEEKKPTIHIQENPGVDVEINEPLPEVEIDEPVVIIPENPGVDAEFEEEKVTEESKVEDKQEETKAYVNSLIDELKQELVEQETYTKPYVDENTQIYERISKIYPYLPNGFIRSVYELKESIANEYPIDDDVIILHRVEFKDVENLRKFVEIGLSHDYTINADEKKMIVDIFKKFKNTDGKIITNIFEIANQGYLLNGEYDGYNVITQQD